MPSEVSERERKVLDIIETARAKRAKFRDAQITMAHGAGGKATASLIEGLLVPAFSNEALDQMAAAQRITTAPEPGEPRYKEFRELAMNTILESI